MTRILICHAEPLDSDRQPGPPQDPRRPDHPLVFWNDECVGEVVHRLRSAGVQVDHRRGPYFCLKDVLQAVGEDPDLDALVIFGHGKRPPAPREVFNRRNGPRDTLVNEDVVRAASQAGQVFLACHSFAHFENLARDSGVPVFVGFVDQAATPAVLADFARLSPVGESEKDDLVKHYRELYVRLVLNLVQCMVRFRSDSSSMAAQCKTLVEQCRQQLLHAAVEYQRLLFQARGTPYELYYSTIIGGFIDTWDALRLCASIPSDGAV